MISICLTNFNRYEMLFESFAQVYDDPRISEIIISDDCSDYAIYQKIQDRVQDMPKVKLSRTDTNIDCYRNKRRAVSLAKNAFVILFDSDNILTRAYIDAIYSAPNWFEFEILTPAFAKPHFDFRRYAGMPAIEKETVHKFMNDDTFQTMLNAANYFVNRDEYLRVWDSSVDPVTSDSIYQAYRWLDAGNNIFVMPGMEYDHRVNNHSEEGSHYAKNVRRTARGFHDEVVNKLKAMR